MGLSKLDLINKYPFVGIVLGFLLIDLVSALVFSWRIGTGASFLSHLMGPFCLALEQPDTAWLIAVSIAPGVLASLLVLRYPRLWLAVLGLVLLVLPWTWWMWLFSVTNSPSVW